MVMMSRPHMPFFTNSHAIRQEIQRFESVHPSIYAIYDLIELVQDPTLAQQVREHVVCIEDSFVNSQEWTLSRSVPDLRLGIVGSLSSGKSALVHRYLTGSYMQEESPEGGRFKKEVSLDGQSYLLLIRDEGGPPELQFSAWVDAVVFVFSLENESSFNAIYHYYSKMNFFRNTADVPIILVGTQDAVSETNPRIIDEGRARKLASELKRCTYFETCATYGLNVEAVFQVACQKVLQQRLALSPAAGGTSSRPSTPSHLGRYQSAGAFLGATSCSTASSCSTNGHMGPPPPPALSSSSSSGPAANCSSVALADSPTSSSSPGGGGSQVAPPISAGGSQRAHQQHATPVRDVTLRHFHSMSAPPLDLNMPPPACVPAGPASASAVLPASSAPTGVVRSDSMRVLPSIAAVEDCQRHQQPPTPGSTPTSTRKSRRRSNLFAPSRKAASAIEDERRAKNGELGVGRAIPVKQGYLYKRSQKALNRDWKKKYVTIHDDGRLVYHSSLHEYMEDAPGKEICLQYTTVKVPGQKPRGSRTITTPAVVNLANNNNNLADNLVALSITSSASLPGHVRSAKESVMLTAYEVLRDTAVAPLATPDDTSLHPQSSAAHNGGGATITADTPSVKKRHRRPKGAQGRTAGGAGGADSGGGDQDTADVSDVFEFCIVSLDNKTWHFEAGSHEERDVWVSIIEQQILSSLQSNESSKSKSRLNSAHDTAALQSIKHSVPGNTHCVDCGAPNPDWASLNLGSLMCIECGGVHRNLGSHISRVRSLDLDEWPPGHLAVMRALGNALANSIWEAHIPAGRVKPSAGSSREEKERWIRAKYEQREFLQPPPGGSSVEQQLVEAVCRADARAVTLALAHSTDVTVNTPVSPRDPRVPLHLAAGLANLPVVQLLIWRGADVRRTDGEGRGAITFARSAGPPGLPVVDLLLSAGAPDVANPTSVNPAAAASIASRRRASMNPRELASII